MLEGKKKIFLIGAIIIILVIIGSIYYIYKNEEEEYIDFEEAFNVNTQNEIEKSEENNTENEKDTNEKLEAINQIVIHISGQVVNPGVISLKEGARVIDAVNAAGGLTAEADINKVNLAFLLSDAQKIYIPSVKEKEEVAVISEGSGSNLETSSQENKNVSEIEKLMVNINTASETELQKLPGIGNSIASRIVAYRKENGKFNTIEEIQNVSGIGSSKFNNIKNYICVK